MPKFLIRFLAVLCGFLLLRAGEFSSASALPMSTSSMSASPIHFIENVGQFDPRARFLVQGTALSIWIAEDGLWLTLPDRDQTPARDRLPILPGQGTASPDEQTPARVVHLHLTFPDHAQLAFEPFARQETTLTYYTPQGAFPAVPVWGGVRVTLAPGLTLDLSSQEGQLTFAFEAPAGVRSLPLHIEGAEAVRLEAMPVLVTPLGEVALPLQTTAPLSLHLTTPETAVLFDLQPAVTSQAPESLPSAFFTYSTYLGGSADDQPNTIAIHPQGEIYIAGETYSLPFPSTPGLDVPTHLVAAFLAKLNASGTALDYLVNIISDGLTENVIRDLVVDAAGNAYVGGFTDSADFPATPGAYDTVRPAATDLFKAFVMKLNPAGEVVYATLLGTNEADELGNGLAVDAAGNAYLTGYTESANFPTTLGAYDRTLDGERDAFVTKFNATGSGLIYSTLLGGTSKDNGERLALDGSNNVIMSGYSEDGPTYPHSVTLGPAGVWDIVVSKLNTGGTGLIYSTIIGGSSYDFYAQGLALDAVGNAYLSGESYSADFPTTPGAFAPSLRGTVDPVVFKLNAGGTALGFSTYLGGSDAGVLEFIYDLALDENLRPYVVGYTDSADFPTTPGAFGRGLNGPLDMFAAMLTPTGSGLEFSTLVGGSLEEYGAGIAIKAPNEFAITGASYSADFPTTPGALDRTANGGGDGVVVVFRPLSFSVFLPLAVK
ncbi:MAG: SBBP repeat-containing protein [Anaerolineales bacterium]|nr:SBBP repeat-containing protein [Anaerolineales bacterium]